MHVAIIGAGWAGLAAALELSRHNIKVTLLDSAKQAGGRARTIQYGKHQVDNGQHLLIGAYHNVLHLLEMLDINEADAFLRQPLTLDMLNPQNTPPHLALQINAPALPAPFHLLIALLKAKGITLQERWQALKACLAITKNKGQLKSDVALFDYLKKHHQSTRLISYLWEPLCLATLNTPISQASAQVFCRVITDTFVRRRYDSDLLFPRTDLSALLPSPALAYIKQQGGTVRLGERVTHIHNNDSDSNAASIKLSDEETLSADHIVLATSAPAAVRLLTDHAQLSSITRELEQIKSSPIYTVYLQYPENIRLDKPMIGLVDSTSQWLFDRSITGQAGLMAVVISSEGPHIKLDNKQLIENIIHEVASIKTDWPRPVEAFVIKEKRATFLCEAGINDLRPGNQTTINNLWLAGDYTDTGYPATLEGAVRSGLSCARSIIAIKTNLHK